MYARGLHQHNTSFIPCWCGHHCHSRHASTPDGFHALASQIALIDIHLPGVSGLDLSWCYQQMLLTGDAVLGKGRPSDEWTSLSRQTILIACTGDQSADTEQLQSYGIRDVLLKPVSCSKLC